MALAAALPQPGSGAPRYYYGCLDFLPFRADGREGFQLLEFNGTGMGGLTNLPWAITDENKPIADGVKPEAGPLKIYNYADYLDPVTVKKFQKQFNVKVQVATPVLTSPIPSCGNTGALSGSPIISSTPA